VPKARAQEVAGVSNICLSEGDQECTVGIGALDVAQGPSIFDLVV